MKWQLIHNDNGSEASLVEQSYKLPCAKMLAPTPIGKDVVAVMILYA